MKAISFWRSVSWLVSFSKEISKKTSINHSEVGWRTGEVGPPCARSTPWPPLLGPCCSLQSSALHPAPARHQPHFPRSGEEPIVLACRPHDPSQRLGLSLDHLHSLHLQRPQKPLPCQVQCSISLPKPKVQQPFFKQEREKKPKPTRERERERPVSLLLCIKKRNEVCLRLLTTDAVESLFSTIRAVAGGGGQLNVASHRWATRKAYIVRLNLFGYLGSTVSRDQALATFIVNASPNATQSRPRIELELPSISAIESKEINDQERASRHQVRHAQCTTQQTPECEEDAHSKTSQTSTK